MSKTISVVVADDSPFICRLLKEYLESDSRIEVLATVLNGKEAVESIKKLKPDVATLDLNMPIINGLDTLALIMNQYPLPVVLISGVGKKAALMTRKGLALGAVDFIFKHSSKSRIAPATLRNEIIAKVSAASRVKVIRQIPSIDKRFGKRSVMAKAKIPLCDQVYLQPDLSRNMPKIVVIGASTGGPLALKALLAAMEETGFGIDSLFSVVIVQHMPEGFTEILAEQFDNMFSFKIKEAEHNEFTRRGTVFIAPGNRHLLIESDGRIQINMAEEVKGHRPSIDVTMQSAAQSFGNRVTGVILSGMGDDGAKGMLSIKTRCGATYAQSSETCVIDTMPVSAIKQNIIEKIGSPADIGRWLITKAGDSRQTIEEDRI